MTSTLYETPLAAASSADPGCAEEGDRRILIVDDEESVRGLFANFLGERYLCSTAADVEEALAYLASEPFALVISDVNMPGLSGVELLRKIIASFPDTAVI